MPEISAQTLSDQAGLRQSVPRQVRRFPLWLIALDIGGTKIAGAVVRYESAGGPPVLSCVETIPTRAACGGSTVLEDVCDFVRSLYRSALDTCDVHNCAGCAVSACGSISPQDGSVIFANELIPGWCGQPLGARLRSLEPWEVCVLNDVHAHALGEIRFGAGQGSDSSIVVAVGTGIGGALTQGPFILQGYRGYAGMLGHTFHPAAHGLLCRCGQFGHLESVASGSGIEDCYERRSGRHMSGLDISKLAEKGDEAAAEVLTIAGRSLGESIATWAKVVDPACVIVSGSLLQAASPWHSSLQDGFLSQRTPEQPDLEIRYARLGGSAPLIGAAERFLDTYVSCGPGAVPAV